MRVAVVGNQSTAVVVTGNLKLAGIYSVHRSNIRLSIDLDSDFVVRHCRSSMLWVCVRADRDITTVDIQLNTVSAQRFRFVVVGVVVVGIVVVASGLWTSWW